MVTIDRCRRGRAAGRRRLCRRRAAARRDRASRRTRARARRGPARAAARAATLIVSVPHRGLRSGSTRSTLYAAMRRRRPHLPPLEAGGSRRRTASTSTSGGRARGAARTAVHRRPGRAHRARAGGAREPRDARAARSGCARNALAQLVRMPLHLIAYIVDDMVPTGPCAYHLAVRARRDIAGPAGGPRGEREGARDSRAGERKESAVSGINRKRAGPRGAVGARRWR